MQSHPNFGLRWYSVYVQYGWEGKCFNDLVRCATEKSTFETVLGFGSSTALSLLKSSHQQLLMLA